MYFIYFCPLIDATSALIDPDSGCSKLIDVTEYSFRVFATKRSEAEEEIWRDYDRRADMENRIAELKHDLGADRFCLKQLFATEAAFQTILLLFNLLGTFQRAVGLASYREPATLRTMVFTCGAILAAPDGESSLICPRAGAG